MYFARKFSRGLGSTREGCWCYVVCLWEPHLVVQRRVQLEHSSHIVKVGVEATCLHFNPWRKLKELNKPMGPFGTMQQEPWYPGIGTKPDCTTQHSTMGKCAPMQVIKQPVHARISITKEQKWSSLQTKCD